MSGPVRVGFASVPDIEACDNRTASPPSATAKRATNSYGDPRSTPAGVGPTFFARLARLLGLDHIRFGRLTAEDLRVLAYLVAALVIAFGRQIDPDIPVNAADQPPAATSSSIPSAAPTSGGRGADPISSKDAISATTAHGPGERQREVGLAPHGAS